MGNERSTSALHAPAGTGKERERRLRRALGVLSASPEVSTQQSSQSCASVFGLPTLWSPGPAAPTLLVLGSALPGRDRGVVGGLSWRWVLPAVLKNLKRHCAPRHVHSRQGQSSRPSAHTPARPCSAPARTPQTGSTPKTAFIFGFFVCLEFIQSLRNLWFWLEI